MPATAHPGPPPSSWTRENEVRVWVAVRLLGWALVGLWQVLSLASEFYPINLEGKALRVMGKTFGLLGLILVAVGFERITHLTTLRRGP